MVCPKRMDRADGLSTRMNLADSVSGKNEPTVVDALSQKHFLGSKYFKILHEHFRDMGGAVLGGGGETYISRYGRCCFKIWEVLYWGGWGA